jgi:hypothetical protein
MPPPPNAKELVHSAFDAQGGEQTVMALTSVQWEASGFRNELEQSERPEGPYQQSSDGTYFYPQTVSEVADAVTREHLSVDKFFMMHIGLTP